jgi:outer membrane protein assembly factor BamB
MAVAFPTNLSFVAAVVAVVSIATEQVGHSAEPMSARQRAAQIFDATAVRGGLVVHLSCGDGKLATELRTGEGFVVHGLDADAVNVEKARAHIRSKRLYGPVSAALFDGKRLPYVDNLVNLLVADQLGDVAMKEVMRVLAPLGVAWIDGKKIVKPWPKEIDEWTHYLHDASGNAVSQDTRVGPPRHLQWSADPRWARSHEHAASVTTMVSGEGKIFYIHDEGIPGVIVRDLPERWALYARDAFSGVLLWKKEFTDWGSSVWNGAWHCREPMTIPRRLVTGGGKVYATLGFRGAAITVLDPDIGEVLDSYQEGENNDELIWHDRVLLVRQRKSIPAYPLGPGSSAGVLAKARRDKSPAIPPVSMGDETLLALDADTGKELWSHEEKRIVALSLAALGESVCYHNLEQIVCLDLRSGRERWRAECPTWPDITGVGGTLIMYDDKVVHAGDRGIQVFSAQTGKRIWQGPGVHRMSVRHPPDLFVIDGRIWGGPMPQIAGVPGYPQLHNTPFAVPLVAGKTVKGFDVDTGEVTKELDVGNLVTPGHHVRCYRSKATSRYLMWPKRGMEFVDILQGKNHERVDWARGECGYGVMPSGGLIYTPPHPCICYLGIALTGFNALAPAEKANVERPEPKAKQRLQCGPAFGDVRNAASGAPQPDAWPTYRCDPARSGHTLCAVPVNLRQKWKVDIRGKLTQPVVADGKVYVVSVDTHTVHAIGADSGRNLWQFTADARIDSPPTIHNHLLLFGCTDGKVYCLRAVDGELVWCFRAAPTEAHCVVRDQVESRWPVHGSVLVQGGVAYFCAGRSSFLDGGLYLYGLDPQTGKLLHEAHLDGPWPDLRKDSSAPYAMEGAKNDVLTGDGNHVFMVFNEFDGKLNHLPGQPLGEKGDRQVRPHLMSTTGLLDDSWFDRGKWTYGTNWPGGYWRAAPRTGQILSFDESMVYALNAFPSSGQMSLKFTPENKGYLLTASRYDRKTAAAKNKARAAGKDVVRWQRYVPIRSRGMVLAGDVLFLAGVPDVIPEDDPYAALDGRMGALLWAVSAADGETLAEMKLASPPVFDGMAAAGGKLFLSLTGGSIICLSGK